MLLAIATYVILVILLLVGLIFLHPEGFQIQPETVIYTTSPLNYTGMIPGARIEPLPAETRAVASIYSALRNVRELPAQLLATRRSMPTTNLVMIDPLDARTRVGPLPAPASGAVVPEGFFVMVAPPLYGVQPALGGLNPMDVKCNYSWLGKRIGYMDVCERNLIRAYISGYQIPEDSIHYEQLPLEDAAGLRTAMERRNLDLVLLYIVPGSPLHRLVRSQELAVLGWSDVDVDRLYAFYPFIQAKRVPLRRLFMTEEAGNRAIVRDADADGVVLAMTMVLRQVPGYSPTTPGGMVEGMGMREPFVSRLYWPEEALDPAYKCYGDPTIANMALCESRYDQQGILKRYPTIWDARCFKDTDCPFWDAAKGRGGCQPSGACEMPVGVRRGAYRRYNADGIYAPFPERPPGTGYLYPGESAV